MAAREVLRVKTKGTGPLKGSKEETMRFIAFHKLSM